MRRFQYFIDLDRTVRIDDKGDDYRPEMPECAKSCGKTIFLLIYL